jgi:serine/threonine protein kinase
MLKGEIDKEQRKKELHQYLEEKYSLGRCLPMKELGLPMIKEIMFVGCPINARSEGVAELRMALWDIAFNLTAPRRKGMGGANKTKLLEQPIPSSYLKLEERVRGLAVTCQQDIGTAPVMKEVEFREKVKDVIPNFRELNQAVTFLHENGVLLHYNTPALSNLYFVDPQWLCDVLAHVVTVPEVNRFIQRGSGPEAGILKTSALFHIFKGKLFPPAFRNQYIELLEKFEVALLLDRNRMLVPSMLPSYPRHTIHHFPTVFPRPPIAYILNQVRRHSSSNEDNLTNFSLTSDPLVMPVPRNFSTPSTPDLHRTGLIMRRFYFMTYVPSGFWPRLISRFLTLSDIIVIVLNALGFSEKKIEETVKVMVSGDISTLVNMEWSYWTTGVELWYMGYSLLRVAEIRPEGTFQDCVPSSVSSGLGRTPTMPFEPSEDCSDLSFQLSGQWMAVEQTPNTGIEILVPDYICPSVIEMEFPTLQEENIENESICVVPTRETSWMSAQLFSLILQQIDTLLEDWFPGIGAKDGGKTQYSIPYVNRVVPCPYCVGNAHQLSDEIINKWSFVSSTHPLDKDSFRSSNSMNSSDEVFNESHARRDLLSSLNQQQSKSKKNSFNDDMYDSSTLVQATRFGFMIETCVAASRGLATLACPVHPSMTLDLLSLTPDLVFGDLPTHFLIDPSLVDQGKYVASGSFGEVYHGAIYPHKSASDDEGREVAIKIDKQDRKHFNMETATKAYNEIRAEVSVLKDLKNDYIVEFVGLTLQPLCFMLEWGTQGSLHDLLNTYHKVDARISPWTLVETSRQVASGLAYLHSRNIVYYDLKSPNILAFRFPTANESINLQSPIFPVHVKITDFGISRKITPGGVVGYKGTPAFMAPEILRYVGMEACTEKVDVFSFGMFMYELLAHQYPFERQNLMHNQIEKLVVDGERPTIQKKELNNPVLFLDIMRWSWSQYYRDRPSASQLESVLSSTEISQLIDAYSLQDYSYSKVTSSCVVTLPIDISSQTNDDTVADTSFIQTPLTPFHTNVVQGDLQEELWFASETADGEWTSHQISIVSFCGRTNFSANSIKNGYSVTSMCSVNQQVWVGTSDGCLVIYETVNHSEVFKRYLAIKPNQKIIYISHLTRLRQVMIVRSDGCFLLFNEYVLEQKIPDSSLFDGRVNGTQLPVLGVSHVKLPITCAIALQYVGDSPTLWCGSSNEVLLAMNVSESRFSNCQKLQARSYSQTDISDTFSHLCSMKIGLDVFVWALSFPKKVLYLWDSNNCTLLISRDCNELTTDRVTDMMVLNDLLYLSTSSGAIIPLQIDPHTYTMSALCSPIAGHHGNVHRLMSLDSRIFPKHWIPTLIGRSNVIEYYRDLLDEEEIADISSRIIGRQCRLLVSVGEGFPGLKKMQLAPAGDDKENFVLLWLPLPK